MNRPKPEKFSERFAELLAEGMLRHGMLGKIYHYDSSFSPELEYYQVFRPTLKARNTGYGSVVFKDVPSLADLRCPTCKSGLKVIKVEETADYVFAGTDCDSDPWTHATGKLVCHRNDKHVHDAMEKSFGWVYREDSVQFNGTIADLTRRLDEIAQEWGW